MFELLGSANFVTPELQPLEFMMLAEVNSLSDHVLIKFASRKVGVPHLLQRHEL